MSKELKGGSSGGRLNQSNVRKMRRGGLGDIGRRPAPAPRGLRQQGVQIGNQCWMRKNLKTAGYNDGSFIYTTDNNDEWVESGLADRGAYTVYQNNENNANTYGYLYNWYAVNDSSGICPTGWHVPSDDEWYTLADNLNNDNVGGKLKEVGNKNWTDPNTGATNETGFTGLPGGYRNGANGTWGSINSFGNFWTTSDESEGQTNMAWDRRLNYNYAGIWRNYSNKANGFSVRCISNSPSCN